MKTKKYFLILLTTIAIIGGLFMPQMTSGLTDRKREEAVDEYNIRIKDDKTVETADMLRMISTTDSMTILKRGKKLTPESALYQARISLNYFIEQGLPIDMTRYNLDSYQIIYIMDRTDMSNRLIVWNLTVSCSNNETLQILLDDNTGIILGFSFYTENELPETLVANEITEMFADYWGVEIKEMRMAEANHYILELESESTIELPLSIGEKGFAINSATN